LYWSLFDSFVNHRRHLVCESLLRVTAQQTIDWFDGTCWISGQSMCLSRMHL